MTHTYKVSGMTCTGCQAKVQSLLSKVEGVKKVQIDLSKAEAVIDMERHVATEELRNALIAYPKYQLTDNGEYKSDTTHSVQPQPDESKSWFQTYKPIVLIFFYISTVTLLVELVSGNFDWIRLLEHFMAGFFLVFSFFKLLNLKGFAESYSMYDVVAKKWPVWGYIYAFIEFGLGLAFLTGASPVGTNLVTFVVMSISIIGVLQSVVNRRKIKCACLGDVFNLPMSTITIIEDALMIVMSAIMLTIFLNR